MTMKVTETEAKYPRRFLAELLTAGEIHRDQYQRLLRENAELSPMRDAGGDWRVTARKIVDDWLTIGTGARNACAIECVMLDTDREQLIDRIAAALAAVSDERKG